MESEEKKLEGEAKEDIPKKKTSDRTLVIAIVFIIFLIVLFFSIRYFLKRPTVYTIEDLNKLNIEGKLEPEEGYLYNGVYSFVKLGGLWYTQLKSPSGRVEYNIALHFGAREVEDLKIKGGLDEDFTDSEDIYVSLNPISDDPNLALAVSEFTGSMIKSFSKNPVIVCDRNETEKCKTREILTCEDKDKAIIWFRESEETEIVFRGNCVEIKGYGSELVRAVDRVLLEWYGIVD